MGINDLLCHLPGGKENRYRHSFYDLGLNSEVVPFNAASALWQFAARHASDHLRGIHMPALTEWAHLLNYLRSICRWNLRIYMDGRENGEKRAEAERRRLRADGREAWVSLFGAHGNNHVRKR